MIFLSPAGSGRRSAAAPHYQRSAGRLVTLRRPRGIVLAACKGAAGGIRCDCRENSMPDSASTKLPRIAVSARAANAPRPRSLTSLQRVEKPELIQLLVPNSIDLKLRVS